MGDQRPVRRGVKTTPASFLAVWARSQAGWFANGCSRVGQPLSFWAVVKCGEMRRCKAGRTEGMNRSDRSGC